tara:strand:+ start:486 stop:1589 length:1104 start_codon:yes stop_codon:yes gene_type:complete
MREETLLILGGYGGAGKVLADLLLQETELRLLIGGRDPAKAEALAFELNTRHSCHRVEARTLDANRPETLLPVFKESRLVIIAAPLGESLLSVLRVALESGTDWMDLLFPPDIPQKLQTYEGEILKNEQVVLTQGGFHPGLPAVLVHHAAACFTRLERAVVALAMNARFPLTESLHELLDEITETRLAVFRDGIWRSPVWKDLRSFHFGPPAGTRKCYPMAMTEMQAIPEYYGLRETGVYAAGFNGFVDFLVLPLIYAAYSLRRGLGRKALSRLFCWGINTFSPKQEWVVIRLEADGEENGKPKSISFSLNHEDAYFLTAAPVVCCLLQYLEGTIPSGLKMMAHAVDPSRTIEDLQRMGIRIETDTN